MTRTAIAILAGALLLAGCSAGFDGTSASSEASAAESSPASSHALDSAGVRAAGTALTVGDVTVFYSIPADGSVLDPVADCDGATMVQVSATSTGDVLLIAPPPAYAAEALSDGSVVIRDATGAAVAALSSAGVDGATAPQAVVESDGLIAYQPVEVPSVVSITLATTALRSATWKNLSDEGGRSLAVEPTTWARSGGLAVDALLWAQLVAAEPEANTQGMHDQLTCHQIGAADKETWNLEPWRPDVGLVQTMLNQCNPS